jgi:hypothetical protein
MKADQWRRSVDGTNEEVGGEVGEMMGTNDGSVSGANGGVGGEFKIVNGRSSWWSWWNACRRLW